VPDLPTAVLLPRFVRSGQAQMALDQSLLDWAGGAPGRLAVRVYGWERPTLSLGRAEPFPAGWDEAALGADGVEVVRRPTGGDAVLHDDEVTFAVAGAFPAAWAEGPRAFALAVAEGVAAGLRAIGVPATVVARGEEDGPAGRPGARPCFARAAVGEVRVGGRKAAGIASRFATRAALSHGSIPLSPRHRDVARYRAARAEAEAMLRDHTRSVGEALGRTVPVPEVEGALVRALAERFGVPLVPAGLSELGIASA